MQLMIKRRTKKESDDLFNRIYLEKKSGKLDGMTIKAMAEKYQVTAMTMTDWLEKMDAGLDRCGNKIYVSKKGIRYKKTEKSFRVVQLTQFDIPDDWVSIILSTYKYLDNRPSIQDRYNLLPSNAKVALWKMINAELLAVDVAGFDYPICSIAGEISDSAIRIKVSPEAEAKWRKLGTRGQTSKSRWVLNNVVGPFLALFD